MKQLGTSIHKDMTAYLQDFGFGGFVGYGSGVPCGMMNWLKANRKVMNAGKMKPERVEKFKELLAMMEQHRRKNQYE